MTTRLSTRRPSRPARAGGVYIAVLGTALVVSLLGLSALFLQRIQSLTVASAADIRQAQLNAESALELALATMKQDANWRTTYDNGNWFSGRGTGDGSFEVAVVDPLDDDLADNPDDPVLLTGIGTSGLAEQRAELMIEPQRQPLGCLRSAVAAGGTLNLQGASLRADGPITANQATASSASVYGNVQAATITGGTYHGTNTVVPAARLPQMPDWTSVFDYYRNNGTQISLASLPTTTPNFGKNVSFDSNTSDWTGAPPTLPTSTISRQTGVSSHTCLRIQRDSKFAGTAQYLDHFLKPGATYNISLQFYTTSGYGNGFRISIYVQLMDDTILRNQSSAIWAWSDSWTDISTTVTAPTWTGDVKAMFLVVNSDHEWGTSATFHIDNLDIREAVTGRFIFNRLLGPAANPFGSNNSQGIYWIDCNGNRLIIERSRIHGTLLVLNPGAGSRVDEAVHWSPAVAGYPALLVNADNPADADFTLRSTSRTLVEKETGVNYNPSSTPHATLGQNSTQTDIYQSQIEGLIVVRDSVAFENWPAVRGQVIAGGNITSTSGSLGVEYSSTSLLNPPPGFTAPFSHPRRANSLRKTVAP